MSRYTHDLRFVHRQTRRLFAAWCARRALAAAGVDDPACIRACEAAEAYAAGESHISNVFNEVGGLLSDETAMSVRWLAIRAAQEACAVKDADSPRWAADSALCVMRLLAAGDGEAAMQREFDEQVRMLPVLDQQRIALNERHKPRWERSGA